MTNMKKINEEINSFSKNDYKQYMSEYRLRSEGEWIKEYFESITSQYFRKYDHFDSKLYNFSRKCIIHLKKFFKIL